MYQFGEERKRLPFHTSDWTIDQLWPYLTVNERRGLGRIKHLSLRELWQMGPIGLRAIPGVGPNTAARAKDILKHHFGTPEAWRQQGW